MLVNTLFNLFKLIDFIFRVVLGLQKTWAEITEIYYILSASFLPWKAVSPIINILY